MVIFQQFKTDLLLCDIFIVVFAHHANYQEPTGAARRSIAKPLLIFMLAEIPLINLLLAPGQEVMYYFRSGP